MYETEYLTEPDTVEEEYFLWLCDSVIDDPDHGYFLLMEILNSTEFSEKTAKFVKNDSNRVGDGVELRYRFFEEYGKRPLEDAPEGSCSFLEMLVALAKKIELNFGMHTAHYWFWEMMRNMGLEAYTDEALVDHQNRLAVKKTIDNVLKKRSDSKNPVTLFPTKSVTMLQKNVEIWYQMSQYLVENYI